MKLFDKDTWQVLGLAAGFIAIFLLACFLISSCIDRCSRNESNVPSKPQTQEIPFK